MTRNIDIGFSGTQEGMTDAQFHAIADFIADNKHFVTAHHGDCIGADRDFHTIVDIYDFWTIGHPPINPSKRAFCNFDQVREPKDYLVRNKDIVNESEFMIIAPRGFEEELRSGTWSTARYARDRQVHGLIFWPNGSVEDLIKE